MKKITLIFMTMILFCGLCACGTDNTAKTDSEEKITVTDARANLTISLKT
ncbi:MAG: hypothetical protein RSB05_04260 [Clostridiales bacterium]